MTPTTPSGAGGLVERERLAGVLRSLAAWLIGETQGDHATLNRGDAADDCLTAAGILATLRAQESKPTAWIVCSERGTVFHFATADGWTLEIVSESPPATTKD